MESYIKLAGISYAYPRSRFVLKDIDLTLNRGQIAGITGDNGSGKTTLGKIIMGILTPDSGSIEIDGVDSKVLKLCERGGKIGYAFQNPDRQLFAASVQDEITFPLEIKGLEKKAALEKAAVLLKRFELNHLKDRVPMRLSRGEKQRLVLAATLAQEPGFLILDEPATGLDRDRKKALYQLMEELAGEGMGLAVISHDLQFIKDHANRIIKLENGEVVDDGC
ncbi:ABC transporter ATP-binding protein [uncultured Acetobacterium sp.]|uniref:energy-coupling factor ABC transporter ATP-binding protein n=1 Tax=uncultured Acetobacterium sp. TaxID=217139 RepID=UPI0025E791DE|nr:ABC transporter ATP-binding protein [uncultured Acetobacterium sp.]